MWLLPYLMSPKFWGILALTLGIAAGSVYVTHHWDNSRYNALLASIASDKKKAVEAALADRVKRDQITRDADVRAAESHQRIVTVTNTIIQRIPVHVTAKIDADYPIPCGLVRVWDAAILNASPDALPYPTGIADDSPCPVKASALAGAGADAIRRYIETSDQLTQLQDWTSAQSKPN